MNLWSCDILLLDRSEQNAHDRLTTYHSSAVLGKWYALIKNFVPAHSGGMAVNVKVILKQDVKGLGKKEDMVNVSDGYARNFLFPRNMAVEASASNINVMNTKKEAEKSKKDRELAQAKALAEKVKEAVVIIRTKAGESGKLFGSITSKDISDKLKSDFKLDIDKKKINLPDSIKSLGELEVDVKLYPEVSAKLTVKVINE